jgi:hypothetical protein
LKPADASGSIDYVEFQRTLRRAAVRGARRGGAAGCARARLDNAAVARLFQTLDVDGNGTIDLNELKEFVEHHRAQATGGAPGAGAGGRASSAMASPLLKRSSGIAWLLSAESDEVESPAAVSAATVTGGSDAAAEPELAIEACEAEEAEDEEEDISSWFVAAYADLQKACKARGIKANSKRSTLVAALESHDAAQ